MAGIVYVLTSDYYKQKNFYKIGCTKNPIAQRLSELNTNFASDDLMLYCVHECAVPDCFELKKKLHSMFEHRREEREFFRLTYHDLMCLRKTTKRERLRARKMATFFKLIALEIHRILWHIELTSHFFLLSRPQ